MKFASWKLGFRIKEVPIIFQDRTFGQSKMNKGIVKEGILGVLKLRWHSLFTNYRRRVKKQGNTSLPHRHPSEIMAESK
jgi:dolichol-phosphate mannosyltransferase